MSATTLPSREPVAEPIVLRPVSHFTSAGYTAESDFGHTSQGHWYRMRDQRIFGWPLEALRYFLRLSMWDEHDRLWQCATTAVIDDFGNLVEVMP